MLFTRTRGVNTDENSRYRIIGLVEIKTARTVNRNIVSADKTKKKLCRFAVEGSWGLWGRVVASAVGLFSSVFRRRATAILFAAINFGKKRRGRDVVGDENIYHNILIVSS